MAVPVNIGDFIAILKLADGLRRRFVDAPKQYKAIGQEVKSLAIVLRDTEDLVDSRRLTDGQGENLCAILKGCHELLVILNDKLSKFSGFESNVEVGNSEFHDPLREKISIAWQRLRWNPSEISELRERIATNVSLFVAFQCQISRRALDRIEERQITRTRNDQRVNLLKWLTSLEYGMKQSDCMSKRQPGTGQWLLDSELFQNWESSTQQTLFCPGIPGAGKTIQSAIVIDHLQNKFQNDGDNVGIAFIFCNYQPQQKQKPEELLLSLCKQLIIGRNGSIPVNVIESYKKLLKKGVRPTVEQACDMLESITVSYGKLFIVLDALDEYYESDIAAHGVFVSQVLQLQRITSINIFATSRHNHRVASLFSHATTLEISACEADLMSFVEARLSDFDCPLDNHHLLREEITAKVIKVSNGMFLLAHLHMASLVNQPTIGHLKRAIKGLPSGSESLDKTYENALARIDDQSTERRKLAYRALGWVAYAEEEVNLELLRCALAINEETSELDYDFAPDIELLGSICAGLITISGDDNYKIARLVHYTTREFFDRKKVFAGAHKDMVQTCIKYFLLSSEIDRLVTLSWKDKSPEEIYQLDRYRKLRTYAMEHWHVHVTKGQAQTDQLLLRFLTNEQAVFMYGAQWPYSRSRMTSSGLFPSSQYGWVETTRLLLQHGLNLAYKNAKGMTALHCASMEGHVDVVRLLLSNCDSGLNTQNQDGNTPLYLAVARGHIETARCLANYAGIDLHTLNRKGQSVLHKAADLGSTPIVQILHEAGINLDLLTSNEDTALSIACYRGEFSVVQYLITNGAQPDLVNSDKQSALMRAAHGYTSQSRTNIISLLLESSNNVDAAKEDLDSRSALSYASEYHNVEAVRLLLQAGVNPNQQDRHCITPLIYAFHHTYIHDQTTAAGDVIFIIAQLLIDYGAEADLLDYKGRGAIWRGTSLDGVSLLVKHNAKGDRVDIKGRAPISFAAQAGQHELVQYFAENGAEFDRPDSTGRSPLSWATNDRKLGVVKYLMEKGADPNRADITGRTPLSWAAAHDSLQIVIAVHAGGACIDAPDYNGQTPFMWAVRGGYLEVARYLLQHGAQVDFQDKEGRTALSRVIEAISLSFLARKKIIHYLLEHGADAQRKDFANETPISRARALGHPKAARIMEKYMSSRSNGVNPTISAALGGDR